MSEMVERVARALCRVDLRGDLSYVDAARAAIAAMREPTPEMVDAAAKAAYDEGWDCGGKSSWPDTGLFVDADGFRDCARAAFPAAIDAALAE